MSMARAIRCKNKGGMVENEKLHPSHEPAMSHAASIAHAILASRKGYAMGGSVEEDPMPELNPGDEMEAMSESGDDFLSDEADTPLSSQHMPIDEEHEVDGMEKQKGRLSSILNGIRKRNMRA